MTLQRAISSPKPGLLGLVISCRAVSLEEVFLRGQRRLSDISHAGEERGTGAMSFSKGNPF